ncbi:MAG: triple tyrosine motif-containing protein [Ferruginibacter sp.]
MLKKIFINIIPVLLFAVGASSQTPSQIIFSRITKQEGLASNTAFQTVRDKEGFLWIATQNGLQRYDANRFLTFRHVPGDTSSIAANSVSHLYIDRKDRLWLLFENKVGIFNRVHFKFKGTKVNAPIAMVKKIMEDDQGRIILFADNKQFVYDETQKVFNPGYPLPVLPANYTIGDLAIDSSSNTYWFTGKQGSLLYDAKTKQFNSKEHLVINDPLLDSFISIKSAKYPFVAKDGSWWVVNWIPFTAAPPALYHYDKKQNQLQAFEKIRAYKADSYYEIWSIFQQSNGTIWIYGMGLLAYYNKEEDRFIHINSDAFQKNGIDYDFVSNLYEDKEKNVWVSSNKGLYRFNIDAQVFRNVPSIRLHDTAAALNTVSRILQTKNNGIWASTWGAGIFSYNNELQPIANPVTDAGPMYRNMHVGCMMQRRNGEIWIGLQTGDLVIYDATANKTSVVGHSLLKGNIIEQLLEDHNGNTWIGSNSGTLVKCEAGNWKDSSSFRSMLTDASDIFRLYEDSSNHLWVCTATSGLYKIDPSDGHVLKQYRAGADKNDGLLNDGATDIVQWNDSIYLIASDGLCILNNNTNRFSYLTAADGLPAEHITSFIIDKQKRIWVALDAGIYRLNIGSKVFVSYDAADGIIDDNFQTSSPGFLQDGRIGIGTLHSMLVFDPEKTIDRRDVPPVTITGLSLNNKYISVDSLTQVGKLTLPYNNTFISIELSTLNFRGGYYMYYMLDGLDKNWKNVYNNEITYQYLPPGDYTLKLKSQNGEGTESKIITTLQIHVNAPFWKTWWFYSLLILLIGALLFWFDHARMKRKEAILKMRSNIADGLHQEINVALSNITILSEMAKIKADSEPQKSKEFIEQIHTKANNMSAAMDDILWSIDPNNDSMENFILRYREYIDAIKNQYSSQVDLLVEKNVESLHLKMKLRNDIFWLFKNGIRNVVKTGARNSRIHITYEKLNLIYTLEFNTAGMDMNQLNNIRLRKELTDKLQDVNAKLNFTEYETKAAFVLSIPVNKNNA